MEGWKVALFWTAIGAFLSTLFGLAITIGYRNLFNGVSIESQEEPGPTTREHGFTESSVKVTVKNDSGQQLSIVDVRLMFTRSHGFPVLPEAPPLRSHSPLPAILDTGASISWHFPSEKMARFLHDVSLGTADKTRLARLRPRITTAAGKTYKGGAFDFSLDVNSHWL